MIIFVSADFIVTKESEQRSNVRWLFDFLQRPLNVAPSICVHRLLSGFRGEERFDRSEFFRRSGIEVDRFTTHFDFNPEIITDESVSYLQDAIGKEVCIVGYELSDATRSILNRAGIFYIDIWLGPLRYLDDVYFAVKSSDAAIQSEVKRFEPPEELFYMHADRLRVQNYRGFKRGCGVFKPNSAVFVGQTLSDKALCRNSTMLTILNFKDDFIQLRKDHAHVYYSRHPFLKSGDEKELAFVKSFNNVSVVDTPAYEMLSSAEISTVATISSSVATEAKYFGKVHKFFYRPPVDIDYTQERRYSTVGQPLFTRHFWSEVLRPKIDTLHFPPVSFESPKDKIRDTLAFYWGYRNIDKLESLKITVSKLLVNPTK
jgi:hypothetical protein